MARTGEFALLAIYVDGPIGVYAAALFEEEHNKQRLFQFVLENGDLGWICHCGARVSFGKITSLACGTHLWAKCVPAEGKSECRTDCARWDGNELTIDHKLHIFPTEAARGTALELAQGIYTRLLGEEGEEERMHQNGYFLCLTSAELACYRSAHAK